MKKEYALLIGVGLISGVVMLATIFDGNESFNQQMFFFGAGISYGIITGMYFVLFNALNHKLVRFILWVFASTTSYTLAVLASMLILPSSGEPYDLSPDPFDLALGGLVGALVLTIAFHFIFQKSSFRKHISVIIVGVAVAYTVAVFNFDWSIFILYIVWQTAITTLLGWSLLARK